MSTDTVPIAVLNAPRQNKDFLAFARAVHDHLDGNESFPSPTPTLTEFAANIDAFDKAETAAASRAVGTAEARDAKMQKVKGDLNRLRNYVQSVVEAPANVRNAAALIKSAFMSVKKTGRRQRAQLSAKNIGVSGTVLLDAKAVAQDAVYFWQYSLDQQTWTSVPETMQARTELKGLTPATRYYFRFRARTRAGEIDFSQVVSLLVV